MRRPQITDAPDAQEWAVNFAAGRDGVRAALPPAEARREGWLIHNMLEEFESDNLKIA